MYQHRIVTKRKVCIKVTSMQRKRSRLAAAIPPLALHCLPSPCSQHTSSTVNWDQQYAAEAVLETTRQPKPRHIVNTLHGQNQEARKSRMPAITARCTWNSPALPQVRCQLAWVAPSTTSPPAVKLVVSAQLLYARAPQPRPPYLCCVHLWRAPAAVGQLSC